MMSVAVQQISHYGIGTPLIKREVQFIKCGVSVIDQKKKQTPLAFVLFHFFRCIIGAHLHSTADIN